VKNSLKVWIFLAALALSIVFTGHYFGGRQGVLLGVILTALFLYSLFFLGKNLTDNAFKSKILLGTDPWGALEIVKKLSVKARIPQPKLKLVPWDFPTILVSGSSQAAATIYVTEGLLLKLNKYELEAVIAQQMARIKRQDIFISFVFSVLVSCLLKVTANGKQSRNPIKKILLFFLAPIGSLVIKISIRSRSYIDADALAIQWLEQPKDLATALLKLESYSQTGPINIPFSMANMFIVSPLTDKGWGRYFNIQPPASKRIEKIVGYFPI